MQFQLSRSERDYRIKNLDTQLELIYQVEESILGETQIVKKGVENIMISFSSRIADTSKSHFSVYSKTLQNLLLFRKERAIENKIVVKPYKVVPGLLCCYSEEKGFYTLGGKEDLTLISMDKYFIPTESEDLVLTGLSSIPLEFNYIFTYQEEDKLLTVYLVNHEKKELYKQEVIQEHIFLSRGLITDYL